MLIPGIQYGPMPSVWVYGKVPDNLKELPDCYLVSIKGTKKYFLFDQYSSKQDAKNAAVWYQYHQCQALDLIKNQIRYVDFNTIEVKLTRDNVMITDASLLDTVQRYCLIFNDGLVKYLNEGVYRSFPNFYHGI